MSENNVKNSKPYSEPKKEAKPSASSLRLIEFYCQCGAKLKTTSDKCCKYAKCPHCKGRVLVPSESFVAMELPASGASIFAESFSHSDQQGDSDDQPIEADRSYSNLYSTGWAMKVFAAILACLAIVDASVFLLRSHDKVSLTGIWEQFGRVHSIVLWFSLALFWYFMGELCSVIVKWARKNAE